MTLEEIRSVVHQELNKIAPEADIEMIKPDEDLREELDIDSMDWLNFLVSINEQLGVEIPESDYQKLDTLSHVYEYLLNAANGS